MSQVFYSNGKLLVSGEYVVLDGALAFALPTQYGQSMEVVPCEDPAITWVSYDQDGSIWMNEKVTLETLLSNQSVEGSPYLQTLVEVLRAAHRQNKSILTSATGYNVVCKLTFPRLWGLGTSSTWINNVAQWFKINAYELLANSFGGSGYDIACAKSSEAVCYRRTDVYFPTVEDVVFNPNFTSNLYFVYLNKKMNSKEGIANYKEKRGFVTNEIECISTLSRLMATCSSLPAFKELIKEHESIIGSILGERPIKESLFSDFEGEIKSLGAWGGDFVLVACDQNPSTYFTKKGYHVVIAYKEMIL